MSKYEFKSFSMPRFDEDLAGGWKPTYRVCQDYDDTPRDLEVVYLGANATYKEQVVSIDLKEDGAVRTHTALSLIHISEPTRLLSTSYAVFCLKKKQHTPTYHFN